jgi:hypothetical protein
MTDLSKMSDAALLEWNRSIGIRSVFEDQIDEPNANARVASTTSPEALADVMHDSRFGSVVNSAGEFRIGDLQIRITPNFVFMGHKSTVETIRKKDPNQYAKLLPNKTLTENGIIVGRVSHLDKSVQNGRVAFNGIDHSIYDWDGTHRSATVIYNDNWFVYRSLGTKVKFQNKRWWGGWWEADTEGLRLEYDVEWDVSRTPTPQYVHLSPIPVYCLNCGYLGKTIDFDISSIGTWGGDFETTQHIALLDSPYNFKYFVTNSRVVYAGRVHDDRLEEDQ